MADLSFGARPGRVTPQVHLPRGREWEGNVVLLTWMMVCAGRCFGGDGLAYGGSDG